jgi:hypothetical protein
MPCRGYGKAGKEVIMKIGKKLLLLWVASMALFISVGIATWMTLDVMEGVSGLTIRFFLGYCGIIVVFQVISALKAVQQLICDWTEKKSTPIRQLLR